MTPPVNRRATNDVNSGEDGGEEQGLRVGQCSALKLIESMNQVRRRYYFPSLDTGVRLRAPRTDGPPSVAWHCRTVL